MPLRDFGPLYAETDLSRFPVEPWNTFSNFIFLAIVIYFSRRTRLCGDKHPLIVTSLPILMLGFIGGVMFHATRSSRLWLFMDFMPIFILALLASCYFWAEILGSMKAAAPVALSLFVLSCVVRSALPLPDYVRISAGYSMLALLVILPAVLTARLQAWTDLRLVIGAVASFAFAVLCRTYDNSLGKQLLPMGTHFLWHVFGAASVWALMEFVLRRDLRTARTALGSAGTQ